MVQILTSWAPASQVFTAQTPWTHTLRSCAASILTLRLATTRATLRVS